MQECKECLGTGLVEEVAYDTSEDGQYETTHILECHACDGLGELAQSSGGDGDRQ